MATEIEVRDDHYYGPLRTPANPMRDTTGNIHSEADAQKLGFRGGLVAGSIHMEMFAPLLLRAFGERWFEHGSLSLYFLTPTLHSEEVRAVVGMPEEGANDAQVQAWAEKPNGDRICEGTAAVGDPHNITALKSRKLDRHPNTELRILADAKIGDEFPVVETRVERKALDERVAVITEPMPWYSDPSRWGGLIATTVNQVNALMAPANAYLTDHRAGAIGLYGAIELRNVNGPLLAETVYHSGGTLLHTGDTPKTEYLWFDNWADDASGKRVLEMRMMLRFMKASSRKYQEAEAAAKSS